MDFFLWKIYFFYHLQILTQVKQNKIFFYSTLIYITTPTVYLIIANGFEGLLRTMPQISRCVNYDLQLNDESEDIQRDMPRKWTTFLLVYYPDLHFCKLKVFHLQIIKVWFNGIRCEIEGLHLLVTVCIRWRVIYVSRETSLVMDVHLGKHTNQLFNPFLDNLE